MDRRNLLATTLPLVAAAVAASSAAADPAGPPAVGPIDEVKARLKAQQDAWNRGDLEAFCADYSDDAVFLSPSGLTRGRADVLARYTKKYGAARATMGTLSFEFLDEHSSAELVTLAMRWQLAWPAQKPAKPTASGLTLIVWRKLKGQWKLVQDASM